MPGVLDQDLTVKGESIERVYSQYIVGKYQVNRRYQRKLIWTLDEKTLFIDSVIRGFPVPIILLAESKQSDVSALEIIDGMQRLNAMVSFIENDFDVGGAYFDLETMAVTKAALDKGDLTQREPKLDRDTCVNVAAYQVPFSIYEFARNESVDDVFRRINSGGRKLSRQELRAAGSTGHFATVVRRIASKIRGDDSYSDILLLNHMSRISITNRELRYGVPVEDIFWVKNGILTKDQVRGSLDEELIADIVAYMVSESPPSSRSEFLDDFFDPSSGDDASNKRFSDIETAVQKRTPELVISDFLRAFDELVYIIAASEKTFAQLLFEGRVARSPRYFQVVFLSFYEFFIKQNKSISNRPGLIVKMDGSAKNIPVPEGGAWGAEQRQNAVNGNIGVYSSCFKDAGIADPATVHWISQLQNILSQSYTEQANFDFKQGFLLLDGTNKFDDQSFDKILQTCVGIANIRKDARGYVLVGVIDKSATARRVENMFGVNALVYDRFYITGIEHEARLVSKNLDSFFQMIIEKIKASKLSQDLRSYLTRNLKSIRYFDYTVYVFDVQAQSEPSNFDGKYFDRNGAQLNEIPPTDLIKLLRRFI